MCFGCLKEPSHCDGSFEYPQHIFWLRNKKIMFSYALFSRGLLYGPESDGLISELVTVDFQACSGAHLCDYSDTWTGVRW